LKIHELYDLLQDIEHHTDKMNFKARTLQLKMEGLMREDDVDPTKPGHDVIIKGMKELNDLEWDLSIFTDKKLE